MISACTETSVSQKRPEREEVIAVIGLLQLFCEKCQTFSFTGVLQSFLLYINFLTLAKRAETHHTMCGNITIPFVPVTFEARESDISDTFSMKSKGQKIARTELLQVFQKAIDFCLQNLINVALKNVSCNNVFGETVQLHVNSISDNADTTEFEDLLTLKRECRTRRPSQSCIDEKWSLPGCSNAKLGKASINMGKIGQISDPLFRDCTNE